MNRDALRDHGRGCADCRSTPLPVERLEPLLESYAARSTTASLSLRVLLAAAPVLAANAVRAYRRRLARSLLLSLAPLPVVIAFNVYLLREAYTLLSGLLPGGVVAWMVVGYGSMLVLLCALTYAALPLLMARAEVDATGRQAIGTPIAGTTS